MGRLDFWHSKPWMKFQAWPVWKQGFIFVSCYTFDEWSRKGAAGLVFFAEDTITLTFFEWHKFSSGKSDMLMKKKVVFKYKEKIDLNLLNNLAFPWQESDSDV